MRNREAESALDNFRRCADEAPDGTYQHAKALASLLGDTCDNFMRELRELGYSANNCDLIFRVEAALYDYVKQSNPDAPVFPTAEGFGESMHGPARERVLAQAASNLQFLRSAGIVQ